MSQRRMFSPDIVDSDAFLDMPVSSQLLYFHLAMRSDDDGFVNPKKVMRLISVGDDDLKVLLSKRFLLPFESGVVVIKHWLIHNLIRADLYKETLYKNEKKLLGLNENGSYTELRDGVSPLKALEAPEWLRRRRGELRTASVPQSALRLGKVRLGKDNKEHTCVGEEENPFMEFYEAYPKKVSKQTALRAWFKLKPDEALVLQILLDIEKRKKTEAWQKEGGQFVPYPATYLNQRRWEDEYQGMSAPKALKI